MSARIFFLGNALFDISVPCDAATLEFYELEPDGRHEATERHENLFRNILQNPYSILSPGGSAANSARVSQWLFNSWGMGQTTFVGCIGNDCVGGKLKSFFEQANVNAILEELNDAPTGITAALVLSDGHCTLCASLGAAKQINPNFLRTGNARDELERSDIVYLEGFFISHSSECAVDIANYANENTKIFAINLSAAYICTEYYDVLRNCIACADYVFGNKSEAMAFVNMSSIKYKNVEDCAIAIASVPGKPRVVIITQGSDPVIVATHRLHSCTVVKHPVPTVEHLVDTTGCGDAFVGGVLACLARDKLHDNMINCGIYCATQIAEQHGCTLPKTIARQTF